MTSDEIRFGIFLRSAELKVTKARVDMLATLSGFSRPIPIKDLARRLPAHDVSTLYRTLEALVAAGLARKISVGGSESLYETEIGRHHHHHMICKSCGRMEDVEACADMPSSQTMKAKGFAELTDHSLEFFGTCKNCYSR